MAAATNVTDRPTDRQTTCDRNIALCTKVRRAVKTLWHVPSICYRPSVCLSICLSHGWISQKSVVIVDPLAEECPNINVNYSLHYNAEKYVYWATILSLTI